MKHSDSQNARDESDRAARDDIFRDVTSAMELYEAFMDDRRNSNNQSFSNWLLNLVFTVNYHPDEVELWLMDFKMLEFKRYVDCMPPHVKYILLEKSEDLVFDIIDKLTELLDDRQYVFSQK